MTRCPSCFTRLRTDRSTWTCTTGACAEVQNPAIQEQRHQVGARHRAAAVGAPSCEVCGSECAEVCTTCSYRMPLGWRGTDTVCIAMAGARLTGKSIYIAVLVKELQQLGERRGVTVRPANEHTARVYADVYERPLFEQRGFMEPTPPIALNDSYQREPLLFAFRSPDGSQRHLVLRDVGGEDLENPILDPTLLDFFKRADGIVFLVDPLRVPEIRDRLHDLVPDEGAGGDPGLVLDRTLQLMGTEPPRLAVVLSKFDAMQALREVTASDWSEVMRNQGAAFLRDPGPTDGYDERDGDLLHEEVRSLLHRLRANQLVGTLSHAESVRGLRYRCFAVSALGEPPDGRQVHPRGIAPFRCLDPLNWILHGQSA